MKKILLLEKNPLVMILLKKIMQDYAIDFYYFSGEEINLGPWQEWDIRGVVADEETLIHLYPHLTSALEHFSVLILSQKKDSPIPHVGLLQKPFAPHEILDKLKEINFLIN